MKRHILFASSLILFTCGGYSVCQPVSVNVISIDNLRELQAGPAKDFVLIDVASPETYRSEHISGSINIPQGNTTVL